MTSQRLLVVNAARLARIALRSQHHQSSSALLNTTAANLLMRQQQRPALHTLSTSVRYLSSKGGDGKKGKNDEKERPFLPPVEEEDIIEPPVQPPKDDPFGLNFDDGSDGLGPTLPPSYKRDKTTGAFTGEIESELSDTDKELLKADSLEQDRRLLDSVEQHWKKGGVDESGSPTELNQLGQRVRESDMALNVIGRSVRAQASAEALDDGSELGRDKDGFSQHLTKQEFQGFADYMKKKHNIKVAEDDIPVQENKSARTRRMEAASEEDPDQRELSLKWLTARAQRQLDDALDDNPYSDLMPGDLSPSRLVNRRRAKLIPRKLMHQNNIDLLRHFVAPTGLIRSRVQTRLGAKDQRKVSKMIKRARNLGLIPYAGQFKTERHGWMHAPDIHEEKEWERAMVERGLTLKKKEEEVSNESNDASL